MSGITRSDLYLRSIKVHNQSSNILEMDLQGNLMLNTKNINSDVKEELNFRSTGNQNISTINGNLTLSSKNSSVVLRNGEYVDDDTLLYNYNNLDVDETDNTYFNNDEILNLYTNKEDVVSLRDDSLLIESLNQKKLTLYGNNGINLVSHNGIKSITDEDCIIQSNKKINLTLGFITFNSERLISSVEENISFFSSTGDILLGGNGITNNGIKISSNSNNNFVGLGKSDDAERSLDVKISSSSNDNNNKNGIKIINNDGSKNSNNFYINPEVVLSNTESNTNSMGIGPNNDDNNLKIIASKINIGSKTYLKPLNNFNFSLQDIGRVITWNDDSFPAITVNNILNDTTHGIIGLINRESDVQISFGYQIGYINRDNFTYIRSETSSNLSLGTSLE